MANDAVERTTLAAIGAVDMNKALEAGEERNLKTDEMLSDLMDNLEEIKTVWDYDFINSLTDQRDKGINVTLKQYEQILRIYNKWL